MGPKNKPPSSADAASSGSGSVNGFNGLGARLSSFSLKDYCVVVACRGAIAHDIIRRCTEIGISRIIAVVDEGPFADNENAPWLAGFSGPVVKASSYTDVKMIAHGVEKIIAELKEKDPSWAGIASSKVLIDPGYGFFAENPKSLAYFKEKGFIVVSPALDSFESIGNKSNLREFALSIGVPVLPSGMEEIAFSENGEFDKEKALKIAFRLIVDAKIREFASEKNLGHFEAFKEFVKSQDFPRELKKYATGLSGGYEDRVRLLVEQSFAKNAPLVSDSDFAIYPIRVKGSAEVGGGRSHSVVYTRENLHAALEEAYRQMSALKASPRVMMELNLERARHIEINMIAYWDEEGRLCIVESESWRDCSVQDRNQKMIERTVNPKSYEERIEWLEKEIALAQDKTRRSELKELLRKYSREAQLLKNIRKDAEKIVQETGTTGVFTIEFLVDSHQNHWILEANLRKQVERDISKVTATLDGKPFDFIDLFYNIVVAESLGVSPEPAPHRMEWTGEVALECRICTLQIKEPHHTLIPSTEDITRLKIPPEEPGVFINMQNLQTKFDPETGAYKGDFQSPEGNHRGYVPPASADPMIGTVIVTGKNTEECMDKMAEFLSKFVIEGPQTTIPLYLELFKTPEFRNSLLNDVGPGIDFFPKWVSFKVAQNLDDNVKAAVSEFNESLERSQFQGEWPDLTNWPGLRKGQTPEDKIQAANSQLKEFLGGTEFHRGMSFSEFLRGYHSKR